jgi:hypothetical protein
MLTNGCRFRVVSRVSSLSCTWVALIGVSAACQAARGNSTDGLPEEPIERTAIVTPAAAESAVNPVVEPVDLAGHWSGAWYSYSSSHKGPLFAQFCRMSNGDYQVHFRGRFAAILPFRYSVVLRVVDVEPGLVRLRGQANLGRLFGTFTYEATATNCEFQADYDSCQDRGKFWLRKCCH